MNKTLITILLALSTQMSFAQSLCSDFFKNTSNIKTTLQESKRSKLLLEDQIQQFANYTLADMTSEEIANLRAEARKQEKAIESIRSRINTYSEFNGSSRYRIAIEEANRTRKLRYELKRGSISLVVDKLQDDFSTFEVNFLYLQILKKEALDLLNSNQEKTTVYKEKISEINSLEKYIGKNYYRYTSIREMLDETINSNIEEQTRFGKEALKQLQQTSKIHASKQLIEYKKITVTSVKEFLDFSTVARKALLNRAALEEFWMIVKMITLSGPVSKAVKAIVYKLPEKLNIPFLGLNEVAIRTLISEALGVGYNQFIRNTYLEKIEEILEIQNSPEKQLEALQTLNVASVKKDELFLIFARIPENQKTWLAIKEVAQKKSSESEFAKNLYNRLVEAEKKAISSGEFPLYYTEAGVTVMSKITLGGFAIVTYVNHYLATHEGALDSTFDMIQKVLNIFAGG